ncbi:DNA primase [Pectobacterium carotovorum]|nr:DNA primase [Pectobacterium carotovorum]
MRNIDFIRKVSAAAAGRWPDVLSQLGIEVPRHPTTLTPCPACGGTDRFQFDNLEGRGTWHCRHCDPEAGDGLALVMNVRQCAAMDAAQQVAEALGIDARTGEQTASQSEPTRPLTGNNLRSDTEKAQSFIKRLAKLTAQTQSGESSYLEGKGLSGFSYPLLSDGSLLLALQDENGTTTAAQTIKPDGSKRLVTDSAKRGAYHAVNAPDQPDKVVIAEGLATALSVHLMRPDALTVAAIDAGNMVPVAKTMRVLYPNAQIILAADNDITAGKPNAGKDWAEKAAREVNGWVALPPTDEKADWDDYRQQFGLAAATQAFADSLYQLQTDIPANDKPNRDDPLKPRVESRKEGVFWLTPKVDKVSGEVINNESWLCSPLEVIGSGRDDSDQFLILRWHVAGRKTPVTAGLPLADIGEREGWRTLKAGGVTVTTKTFLRAILADWLQNQGKAELWQISHTTGWQCGAYIMPDGDIIGSPLQPVLFRGRSAAAGGYAVKGSATSWRDSIAQLAQGNPSMMTAIAAALAAPLIGLSESDGFGLHFYEQSSAGKTTTANVATSLYGDPDALKLTWYGTALGIANEAEAHNDGLLPLDEVGQGSDARSVSTSAYTLFNGVGKLQGAREGGNRELKRWRTVAISTGEMDMETFLTSAGIKSKAGQLVRLLNLPLEKAQQFHGHKSGKDHADALKAAYRINHGAAGREWIRYLAHHQKEAIQAVREAENRWRSLIPANYGEQVHRVAERFAILEAALLVGRTITGWNEQECRDAIQHSFNAWLREFGTGNKEHRQIVEQCEAFLNAHGLSRFAPFPYDPTSLPIRDLAGYRDDRGKHGDAPMIFYTFPAAFEGEIAKGFNAKQFAEVLKTTGMLTPPTSGRGFQRKSPRIDGRQFNVYVIHYMPEEEATQE